MLGLDVALFMWINSLVGTSPILDSFLFWAMGDYLIPVALSLICLALWFSGSSEVERGPYQRGVLIAIFGMLLANLAIREINEIYFRPRPFAEHEIRLLFYKPIDSSFPSNAAAVGFAMAAGIGFVSKKMGALAYILAGLLGFARVYGGVHYPLDVLAGALLGYGSSYIIRIVLRLIEPLPTYLLKIGRKIYLA